MHAAAVAVHIRFVAAHSKARSHTFVTSHCVLAGKGALLLGGWLQTWVCRRSASLWKTTPTDKVRTAALMP